MQNCNAGRYRLPYRVCFATPYKNPRRMAGVGTDGSRTAREAIFGLCFGYFGSVLIPISNIEFRFAALITPLIGADIETNIAEEHIESKGRFLVNGVSE